MQSLREFMAGGSILSIFVIVFAISGLVFGVLNGFFKARKIQPKGFRWKTFRNEAIFGSINLVVSVLILGYLTWALEHKLGWVQWNSSPASWWVIGLEYALYFFLFDTFFYWLHRLMHVEPMYKFVHKLHHYSTSPNLLTTLSVNPLESVIYGSFVPLFTAAFTVHPATMLLIGPTSIIMGPYVHAGYEFFPRWWNKTWATKWFITTTFHDQHHKYFNYNFGGYMTIWDWACGTVRPKFVKDYEQLKARVSRPSSAPVPVLEVSPEH